MSSGRRTVPRSTKPSPKGPRHHGKSAYVPRSSGAIPSPPESAKAAGLRYVTDDQPGIRRFRAGKGFRYVGPDGKPVRDAGEVLRIHALAIPPAWTDVWICPLAHGHLQ